MVALQLPHAPAQQVHTHAMNTKMIATGALTLLCSFCFRLVSRCRLVDDARMVAIAERTLARL
jgi:hypothetical protein